MELGKQAFGLDIILPCFRETTAPSGASVSTLVKGDVRPSPAGLLKQSVCDVCQEEVVVIFSDIKEPA